MEKIYEEQMGGGKNPRGQINFSIVLSFLVAIFAIISLIAVGFNQISFAAPVAVTNQITVYVPTNSGTQYSVTAYVGDDSSSLYNQSFKVPFYQADAAEYNDPNAIPLFCLEHHVGINSDPSGQNYQKDEVIEDAGLAYILNMSGTLGGRGIVPRAQYSDVEHALVERFATQIAIWVYLHDTQYLSGGDDRFSLANEESDANDYETNKSIIEQVTYIQRDDDVSAVSIGLLSSNGASFYESYILPIVSVAKTNPVLKTLTINGDNKISKVGDDDFYQTEELSVSCNTNDLENYNVNITGIDGAFIVDKDGNKIEEGTPIDPSQSFFVRIPVQSVSETAKTITIEVHGVVNNYLVGARFLAIGSDYQKVVAITTNQADLPAIKEIPVVGSPNTGMNKAQTIYFIGLIVLLCGVGIIYANAKPVETE